MRLAWLTDIHLDFLSPAAVLDFADSVAARGADAVVMTGDLSNGRLLIGHLEAFAARVPGPIYFVLGNHDHYHASFAATTAAVRALCARQPRLCWLRDAGVVTLGDGVGLVGHDGWYDGRNGAYFATPVRLSDFVLIDELRGLDHAARLPVLQALAADAAAHFARVLPEALRAHERVIALTHVPPFAQCATFQGRPSDADWQPFVSSQVVGECLRRVADEHLAGSVLVLCGHSHWPADVMIAPNLRVVTGEADYGKPRIQDLVVPATADGAPRAGYEVGSG